MDVRFGRPWGGQPQLGRPGGREDERGSGRHVFDHHQWVRGYLGPVESGHGHRTELLQVSEGKATASIWMSSSSPSPARWMKRNGGGLPGRSLFGPDANVLDTQSLGGGRTRNSSGLCCLADARGHGLDWKMGVFDSVIGYESHRSWEQPQLHAVLRPFDRAADPHGLLRDVPFQ